MLDQEEQGLDRLLEVDCLVRLSRVRESLAASREAERDSQVPAAVRTYFPFVRAVVERDATKVALTIDSVRPCIQRFRDSEAGFFWTDHAVRIRDHEWAVSFLRLAVTRGSCSYATMVSEPRFGPLPRDLEFNKTLRLAETKH